MATYEEAKKISEHLIEWNKNEKWFAGTTIKPHPILDWYIVMYTLDEENMRNPYSIDDVVISVEQRNKTVSLEE